MQLEARAALPVVSMSLYKGTSESRVMADRVMIGDPVALVVNLASQNIYGMIIKDCYVKDGVDMGGVQPLIDSKGYVKNPSENQRNREKISENKQAGRVPTRGAMAHSVE